MSSVVIHVDMSPVSIGMSPVECEATKVRLTLEYGILITHKKLSEHAHAIEFGINNCFADVSDHRFVYGCFIFPSWSSLILIVNVSFFFFLL